MHFYIHAKSDIAFTIKVHYIYFYSVFYLEDLTNAS